MDTVNACYLIIGVGVGLVVSKVASNLSWAFLLRDKAESGISLYCGGHFYKVKREGDE